VLKLFLSFKLVMVTVAEHIDYKGLYEDLQVKYEALQHELNSLKRMIFGSKHERFVPTANNPAQTSLDLTVEQVATCSVIDAKKITYTRTTTDVTDKKEHPGRMKLPEHLERREIVIEPEEDVSGLKKIGAEITEELEYEPGNFYVNKIVRNKYVRPDSKGIAIAPMIERPLPKAIAGAGLLAHIVIDKYVDHLPLYRQVERFKRESINIAYATITDWISNTCALITPLYDLLKNLVLQSNYLHVDESPIKVLDKDKKGSTHRGFYWVYQNSILKMVLFDYRPGRGREGPEEMLKNFKGHLQTDGYPLYDFFKQQPNITVLNCMAHARRIFFDAKENDAARAEYALKMIGKLYDIERKAKAEALDHAGVLELRQKEAIAILEEFEKWMKAQYVEVPPKSAVAKAIQYCLGRWKELTLYTTDGKLNIDNNPVENSIRPVAVGRKNYLFAGSHEAAQRSAMLYSLLGTCKMHNLNPTTWLVDILKRLPSYPVNKIEDLLPHKWKPA
jgi:transposase